MNKCILVTLCSLVLSSGVFAQVSSSDTIRCSADYRELEKKWSAGQYREAMDTWTKIYRSCPSYSSPFYDIGTALLEHKIGEEKNEAQKKADVDSLLHLYDRQEKYFGNGGKIAGKKGVVLSRYAPQRKEEISQLLTKSINSEGVKSTADVLDRFFTVHQDFFKAGNGTREQVIDAYYLVSTLSDSNLTHSDSSKFVDLQKKADTFFDSFVTCEQLNKLYNSRFEATPTQVELLRKIVYLCAKKECYQLPLLQSAAEKLHQTNPASATATALANVYFQKGNYARAISYYNEAIDFESQNNRKATLLLQLSYLYLNQSQNYSMARTYALRAASMQPEWSEPYLLLGDIYSAGAETCDDGLKGGSAYWVAADHYQKAITKGAQLSDELKQKLNNAAAHFPKKSDLAKLKIQPGEVFNVKCWINEPTVAREPK